MTHPKTLILTRTQLEDIANIRKLSLVMKEGRIVDHESLPEQPIFSASGPES